MIRVPLIFLLFFLPFIIFPFGTSSFESPKVVIAELVMFAVSLLSVIRYPDKFTSKQYFPFYLLILIGAFQLLIHQTSTSFLGNAFRGQGELLLWILALFAVTVSASQSRLLPRFAIPVLLFLQLIASIFIEAKEGRAIGTLGEPNALAAFAIFVWPFVLRGNQETVHGNQKNIFRFVFPALSIALTVLLIIFSGSRSGFVALGIQLVFLFTSRFISLTKATIIALLLLLLSLLPPILDTQTLYENRGEIWRTALYAGYEHPVLGWGFGNTEVAFKDYNQKLYNNLRGYYVDSSHNFVLDWWVQGGIVGLAVLLILMFDSFKGYIYSGNRQRLVLLLGVIAVMSFNPVSVVTLVQFWWLISSGVTNR